MIGDYRHLVLLQSPGSPVPDGDGGWTETWSDLSPSTWHVSIEPATARDLERVSAGTVMSTASHIVKGRYHPGVTTKTRISIQEFLALPETKPYKEFVDGEVQEKPMP